MFSFQVALPECSSAWLRGGCCSHAGLWDTWTSWAYCKNPSTRFFFGTAQDMVVAWRALLESHWLSNSYRVMHALLGDTLELTEWNVSHHRCQQQQQHSKASPSAAQGALSWWWSSYSNCCWFLNVIASCWTPCGLLLLTNHWPPWTSKLRTSATSPSIQGQANWHWISPSIGKHKAKLVQERSRAGFQSRIARGLVPGSPCESGALWDDESGWIWMNLVGDVSDDGRTVIT